MTPNLNGKVVLYKAKLRSLRRNVGLSQESLCDDLKSKKKYISLSTIKRAEKGCKINYRSARLLAEFYQVDIESLLCNIELNESGVVNHSEVPSLEAIKVILVALRISIPVNDVSAIVNKFSSAGLKFIGNTVGNYLFGYIDIKNSSRDVKSVIDLFKYYRNFNECLISICMKKSYPRKTSGEYYFLENEISALMDVVQGCNNKSVIIVDDDIRKENIDQYSFTLDNDLLTFDKTFWFLCPEQANTPFIGRETEYQNIIDVVKLCSSENKLRGIYIYGPAGIGKSRLCRETTNKFKTEGYRIFVINIPKKVEDKVQLQIEFLETVHNKPIEKLKDLVQKSIEVEANVKMIIWLDDVQWAKDDILESIKDAIGAVVDRGVTILITARSSHIYQDDKVEKLLKGFSLCHLEVQPFSKQEAMRFGGLFEKCSDQFIQHCIGVAQGNPLFLEQLLKGNEDYTESVKTLGCLVVQRIKALSEKESKLLKILALCGRRIDRKLLKLLNEYEGKLISQLISGFFIIALHDNQYEFVHQSIQYAVVESLEEKEKEKLLRYLINSLQDKIIETKHAYHAFIAKFFEELGESESAAKYYYLSAAYFLGKDEYIQAQKLLEKSLCFPRKVTSEIQTRLLLASTYKARFGWASPLVSLCYKRIQELASRANTNIGPVLFDEWVSHFMFAELDEAEIIALTHYKASERSNELSDLMRSNIALSNTYYFAGDLRLCYDYAIRALGLYSPERNKNDIEDFGQDFRSIIYYLISVSAKLLGLDKNLVQYLQQQNEYYEGIDHAFSRAIMMQSNVFLEYHNFNKGKVESYSEEMVVFCEKYSFKFYMGIGKLFYAWSQIGEEALEQSVNNINDAYFQWMGGSSVQITFTIYCCVLIEAYIVGGDLDRALGIAQQGIEFAVKKNTRVYLSELYRLKSVVLELMGSNTSVVEDAVFKGKEIAISQGAKTLLKRFDYNMNLTCKEE